jgi:hypothetical protein
MGSTGLAQDSEAEQPIMSGQLAPAAVKPKRSSRDKALDALKAVANTEHGPLPAPSLRFPQATHRKSPAAAGDLVRLPTLQKVLLIPCRGLVT